MWWLIGIAAGLFILARKKQPNGAESFAPMPVRVEIYTKTNKGYPFRYITNVGSSYVLYFNEQEALNAINEAKERRIEIVEIQSQGIPLEDDTKIISLSYRIIKGSKVYPDGTVLVRIDYSNGVHLERTTNEQDLNDIYIRDAKRDGAVITTF